MKKDYEKPKLEIVYFEKQIETINSSIVITYPWGSDNNGFFEE